MDNVTIRLKVGGLMSKQYYCFNCGSPLHVQKDFDDSNGSWICTTCSSLNSLNMQSTQYFKNIIIEDDDEPVMSKKRLEFNDNDDDEIIKVVNDDDQKTKKSLFKEKKDKIKESIPKKKKDWLSLIIICLIAVIVIAVLYFTLQFRKLTSIGISSDNLSRYTYVEVVEKLEEQGFSRIKVIPIYDLDVKDIKDDYKVKELKIDGVTQFTSTKKFLCDDEIVITYHTLKKIPIGISSDIVSSQNYDNLVRFLKKRGFVDIELHPIYDLHLGWFIKDGAVSKMMVNESKKFDSKDEFRPDAKIVITYHTFAKNEKVQESE